MKKNDIQLGKPNLLFKGTTAELEDNKKAKLKQKE